MKDGELDPHVRDPRVAAFGFGRRVCVGRHMAYDSMWMAIVSTLATFDIEKAKDESGAPITPREDYHEAFLWYVLMILCGSYAALLTCSMLHTTAIPNHFLASPPHDLLSTEPS